MTTIYDTLAAAIAAEQPVAVATVVGGAAEPLLEAHLFDFDGDLYGRRIEVEFVRFLRPEQKFENFDALKAQIATDAAQARKLLSA